MSWHGCRKLFSSAPEPLEWEPGEEGVRDWVSSSGAEYLGYREPNLVPSGTPTFRVRGPLRRHLATFPMHHIDCGGASVHLVADDGRGGCVDRGLAQRMPPAGIFGRGLRLR